jgi:HTH-type transcriptional regulator / antitoxin HipB
MSSQKLKTYTLAEMKDTYIGKLGTQEREQYEYQLRMEVLGKMIQSARKRRNMTQEELGQLVGVGKAQISKIENSAKSATIETIIKVFKALNAEVHFNVKMQDDFIRLA